MKAKIEQESWKGTKSMSGSFLHIVLCFSMVLLVSAGCGDINRSLQINDGADATGDISANCGVAPCICDFGGSGFITSVSAFNTGANLNNIVFGADSILDVQALPPETQPVDNVPVRVVGNMDVAFFTSGNPGVPTVTPAGPTVNLTSGTGNGTLTLPAAGTTAVAETWTITCFYVPSADSCSFTVVGSVTGFIGTLDLPDPGIAGASERFHSTWINFTITDGTTDFAANDTFTLTTTASGYTHALNASAGLAAGSMTTGDEGVGVVIIDFPANSLVGDGGEATGRVSFLPGSGGIPWTFDITASCEGT